MVKPKEGMMATIHWPDELQPCVVRTVTEDAILLHPLVIKVSWLNEDGDKEDIYDYVYKQNEVEDLEIFDVGIAAYKGIGDRYYAHKVFPVELGRAVYQDKG